MNIKNVTSAVLLATSAVFLILTLNVSSTRSATDASLAIASTIPRLVPIGNLPGFQVHVTVQDHYAYLIDEAKNITVVDVQTPTTPITVGVGYYNECYTPPHCFPWYPAMGRLVISGTYLYVPIFDLRIVDVANPASPVEVGRTALGNIDAAVVKGRYAYASSYGDYIYVIDVSNPLIPTEVLTVSVPGNGYYMVLNGDYLYVSRSQAMYVLDISNPLSPTQVSSYTINTTSGGPLAVTDHYAYVSDGPVLHVLDVSTPSQITETGRYTTSDTSLWAITASEPYVYMFASGSDDLHALDVSDHAHPIEVASFLGISSSWYNDVAATKDYVYIADDRGLTILRLMTYQVLLPLISN